MKCCDRNTPKVLEVGCCDAPTLFHKVIISASIGDETTMPPRNGAYRNTLVVYEASGEIYFYSSDGIPTHIGGDPDKLKELIRKSVAEEAAARDAADKELAEDIEDEALARAEAITELANQLLDETNARADGDHALDEKIEALEAASDVVDIVGTKAELDDYDTSKLSDNDIIKVLQDETKEDATTYYRWDKANSTFTYIGEEGPYYTQSQTDTLLAGKVDKTSITSTPSFNPSAASETLVMSQKGVARQVLSNATGGVQISCAGGDAVAGSAVSVAIGPGAEAHASPSVAIGGTAKATGAVSVAIGNTSTAENTYSVAVGSNSKASGYSSTALGAYSTAKGPDDIAIGYNSTTEVDSGTQTNNNVAIGTASVKANGGNSFAAGAQNVKATGYDSLAIGARYVEATGSGSIAIGAGASSSPDKTSASGIFSLAVGPWSSATGTTGTAIGHRVVANGNASMAIGHNCTASSATATGTAAQQNIAIGEHAEATGGYSTAFGNIAVASGDTSFAVGVRANATATKSMAIGLGSPNNEVEASGSNSLAIGTNGAKATGVTSTAIGCSATASGANSVAIGYSCTASHYNSVALGSYSQTGRSDEVSIGTPASGNTPEKTKYIAHVTAGVNDTDAVNVKQMNDAIAAAGGGGGSQNVWYATAYGGDPPLLTATTVSGSAPFVLAAGAIVFVKFTNGSRAEFTMRQLKVDNTNAAYISSSSNFTSNETVCFVYDGTNWRVVGKSKATTEYYGEVKLASNYTDNSSYTVPTSAHLHSVYAIANGKQDALTAGTNISISNNTISATDTTYSAGTGINIDANNEISVVTNNINSTDWNALWQ